MERDHDEFILKDGMLAIFGNMFTSNTIAEHLNKKLT